MNLADTFGARALRARGRRLARSARRAAPRTVA